MVTEELALTKAQTLLKIHIECPQVNTLPVFIIKIFGGMVPDNVDDVIEFAKGRELIVRSSCLQEDTMRTSNAGRFKSVLHVKPEKDAIRDAVEMVYISYGDAASFEEEILVQPMLQNIIKSGVVFTRDLYTGAPYYCIDYFEGDDSSAVTSGYYNQDKVSVIFKKCIEDIKDSDLKSVLRSVKVLENFFMNDSLDIEFAITKTHEVYILQVRPIVVEHKQKLNSELFDITLKGISKKIEKLMRPRPFLVGGTTYFGVMPDWNPAEILGIRPKKLAISLYKELITDTIWAHQRQNYGYRDLTQNPLMVLFCGIPYIDTRITFNSFIPASLSDKLAQKLVNYYIDRLKSHPMFHDKIEFEIVFSCYYLGISEDLKHLENYGFNENELKRIEFALLELTNAIIDPEKGHYKKDIKKIEILKQKHEKIISSDISTVDKIYWLIEECKVNGTLPFAGVARAAFVGIQFMKSLIKKNIITTTDYDFFMCNLNTISKQMSCDRKKIKEGEITKDFFLKKYGHIRPGTYDIESPRYDEAYEYYFGLDDNTPINEKLEITTQKGDDSVFTDNQMALLDKELEDNGICLDAAGLLQFIREAIEGREYLKFVFTKTVSEILRQIEIYGERLGIAKNKLAHLDISEIKKLYSDLYYSDIYDVFMQNIENNKRQFEVASQIKLPTLITDPSDVYYFELQEDEPNYITTKSISSKVVKEEDVNCSDLKGKIVCIKAADPGYDYLFAQKIGGLITQFGGANSHMAIRCAELNIPAVIGAGEKNFNQWSNQKKLLLDAGKHQVKIL